MITRMWEGHGEGDWSALSSADGLLRAEIYRGYAEPDRIVIVTHWRDIAALEAFVPTGWLATAHSWDFVRQEIVPIQ